MITPAYGPTATERVLPRLALDFMTGVLDSRIVVTRALNTATRVNSSGLIEIVNANLPRFDYDPTTLAAKGLLIEETRTNLFLNSLIDGTNLATQSVTLAAIAYTVSFYGNGSIAISGGHSATVTGTGDYPSRRTYTFTPTAGSSTFTVTGNVKFAQIEAGVFATSFIPTATTSLTRNADDALMTGTNFSSWYNQSQGTFVFTGSRFDDTSNFAAGWGVSNGTTANEMYITRASSTPRAYTRASGGANGDLNGAQTWALNTVGRIAFAYKTDDMEFVFNANAAITDTSATVPTVSQLQLGRRAVAGPVTYWNGHIRTLNFYPLRLPVANMQALTK